MIHDRLSTVSTVLEAYYFYGFVRSIHPLNMSPPMMDFGVVYYEMKRRGAVT